MEYKMNLHDNPFNLIKGGFKNIKMRVYDDKRRKIKVGDIIEFINRTTLEKNIATVVNL